MCEGLSTRSVFVHPVRRWLESNLWREPAECSAQRELVSSRLSRHRALVLSGSGLVALTRRADFDEP